MATKKKTSKKKTTRRKSTTKRTTLADVLLVAKDTHSEVFSVHRDVSDLQENVSNMKTRVDEIETKVKDLSKIKKKAMGWITAGGVLLGASAGDTAKDAALAAIGFDQVHATEEKK